MLLVTIENNNKKKTYKNKMRFLEYDLKYFKEIMLKMILKIKSFTEFLAISLSYVRYTLSNPAKKFDHNSVLVLITPC